MSKDKANEATGSAVPPPTSDQLHTIEEMGFSSRQEPVASIHPSQQCKNQLLQILYEVREQMKEQQAQSNHKREQVALDRKNPPRAREVKTTQPATPGPNCSPLE